MVKALAIATHLGSVLQMRQGFSQDAGGHRIVRHAQAVMHPFALPTNANDAHSSQIRQMARYFGLARVKDLREVADAELAINDQVQYAQASTVGERLEQ